MRGYRVELWLHRFILSTRKLKAEPKIHCITTIFFRSLHLSEYPHGKMRIRKFWASFLNHYDPQINYPAVYLRFLRKIYEFRIKGSIWRVCTCCVLDGVVWLLDWKIIKTYLKLYDIIYVSLKNFSHVKILSKLHAIYYC